jgi:hypothetical protein
MWPLRASGTDIDPPPNVEDPTVDYLSIRDPAIGLPAGQRWQDCIFEATLNKHN